MKLALWLAQVRYPMASSVLEELIGTFVLIDTGQLWAAIGAGIATAGACGAFFDGLGYGSGGQVGHNTFKLRRQ